MNIQVIKIGRPVHQETSLLVAVYRQRISPFGRIEGSEFKNGDDKKVSAQICRKTGRHLVVLDERGRSWSSKEFAASLQQWRENPAINNLIFLIGGPYGVDAATRDSADTVWSLSPATLPSDLAWLLCWEQIYRAFSIINGTPYHHE